MLIQAPPQVLLNQPQPTLDEFLVLPNGNPQQLVQIGSVVYKLLPNGILSQVLISPLVIQPSPQTGGQLQFQARPQFQAIPSPPSDGTFAVGIRPGSAALSDGFGVDLDEFLQEDSASFAIRDTIVETWQKKQGQN